MSQALSGKIENWQSADGFPPAFFDAVEMVLHFEWAPDTEIATILQNRRRERVALDG